MKFSDWKENWKNLRLSKEEKKQRRKDIQQILSLIGEKQYNQANILCQKMHGKVQLSCSLHPISHLILANIALKKGENELFLEQCWLTFWAPLASFSRRMGADPSRRFFGLGPIRSSAQNRS